MTRLVTAPGSIALATVRELATRPALTGSGTGAYWRRSHVIAESTVEGR
jgi:hypothetical protein